MRRLAERRLRAALLPFAATVLILLGPAMPAAAHPEHIQQITDLILADRQPATFTQSIGPTQCTDGFAGPFACRNVDLLSFTPLAELGGTTAAYLWGWTDPLTGKEYAIVGMSDGTAFVDISTPTDPVVVGVLPTQSRATSGGTGAGSVGGRTISGES
jgi:hypothetical protein